MSGDRAGRAARVNPALAVFGLLCVVVSALVLAGERDWGWLAHSYLAPAILLGLGGIVLAATLWPAGRAATTTTGVVAESAPPDDADCGSGGRSADLPPEPTPTPAPPPPAAEEP